MNKNLDGTNLTRADFTKIAIDNGILTAAAIDAIFAANHNEALSLSTLRAATAKARLKMLGAGLLKLDTRLAGTGHTPGNAACPAYLRNVKPKPKP